MAKKTIKIEKQEIKNAMRHNFGRGPGSYGWAYCLCVAKDGEHHEIHAIENWQQMERYSGCYTAFIPAPYGDGEATLSEEAAELLVEHNRMAEAEALADAEDVSIVEVVGQWYPQEWKDWQEESLIWQADEFLFALNDDFSDLDVEFKWA